MVLPPHNVDAAGFAQHRQLTLYAATTGGHLQPCASVITFGECQEDRASYFTAEIGMNPGPSGGVLRALHWYGALASPWCAVGA